jgi:hypothetical protein
LGKVNPKVLLVTGSMLAGPVDPKQLPKELAQMTKYLSVSIGLLGPIIFSHQPLEGSFLDEAACAEGDKPVKIRTPLSLEALRVPQVSKAIMGDSKTPPFLRVKGPFI